MNTRIVCDRCHIGVEGSEDIEQTSGYYKRKGWKQFMSDYEGILCDDCMWHNDNYIKEYGNQFEQKRFPIQKSLGNKIKTTIPWSVAERAYLEYGRKYGIDQSLEQLAKRGGFSMEELNDLLFPAWKDVK